MFENPGRDERCALLARVKNIAVVGLSPNPARPSHGVAAALQGFGYYIIPVHPAVKEVLGVKACARLADVAAPVDLVNVFRQPEFVPGIVDECIALGLKAIWLQDGVIDEAAALRARAAGMFVVMDRCIYRDYKNEYLPKSVPRR
jgi:predicted CoA-binding protein